MHLQCSMLCTCMKRHERETVLLSVIIAFLSMTDTIHRYTSEMHDIVGASLSE